MRMSPRRKRVPVVVVPAALLEPSYIHIAFCYPDPEPRAVFLDFDTAASYVTAQGGGAEWYIRSSCEPVKFE
jgi:hypothetical protein